MLWISDRVCEPFQGTLSKLAFHWGPLFHLRHALHPLTKAGSGAPRLGTQYPRRAEEMTSLKL